MNVTPHFVVPEAAEAAVWYAHAFDVHEQSRIPLPGGKVMTVVLEIGDSTVHWGERHGQLTDPFGHRWNIAQHLRDVPQEEIGRAIARVFS